MELAEKIYTEDVFHVLKRSSYNPDMDPVVREEKYSGWKTAVDRVRS